MKISLFILLRLFIFESFPFETLTGRLPHSSVWYSFNWPVFIETCKGQQKQKRHSNYFLSQFGIVIISSHRSSATYKQNITQHYIAARFECSIWNSAPANTTPWKKTPIISAWLSLTLPEGKLSQIDLLFGLDFSKTWTPHSGYLWW